MEKLVSNKKKEIKRLSSIYKNLLMNSGVELFNDFASFHDQNILKIGKEFVYSKSFLVAVGTKPRKLSFQASNQIITSDEAFDIKNYQKNSHSWWRLYCSRICFNF